MHVAIMHQLADDSAFAALADEDLGALLALLRRVSPQGVYR